MAMNTTFEREYEPSDMIFSRSMLGRPAEGNMMQPKRMTAAEAAQETFGAAHRLSDRVIAMVNRIAGHTPQDAEGKTGPTAITNGFLEEIKDGARSAHNAMLRANEALDRLEREF